MVLTIQGVFQTRLQQMGHIARPTQQSAPPLGRPFQLAIQLEPHLLRIEPLQQQLRPSFSSPSIPVQRLRSPAPQCHETLRAQ